MKVLVLQAREYHRVKSKRFLKARDKLDPYSKDIQIEYYSFKQIL